MCRQAQRCAVISESPESGSNKLPAMLLGHIRYHGDLYLVKQEPLHFSVHVVDDDGQGSQWSFLGL